MALNCKIGTTSGGSQIVDFNAYGVSDVRTTGVSYAMKENPIDIPGADGAKDGSDGKMAMGTLTVSGKILATGQIESIAYLIAAACGDQTDFYVQTTWDGSPGPIYHAQKVTAIEWSDGNSDWEGSYPEISVTFSIYPP